MMRKDTNILKTSIDEAFDNDPAGRCWNRTRGITTVTKSRGPRTF